MGALHLRNKKIRGWVWQQCQANASTTSVRPEIGRRGVEFTYRIEENDGGNLEVDGGSFELVAGNGGGVLRNGEGYLRSRNQVAWVMENGV